MFYHWHHPIPAETPPCLLFEVGACLKTYPCLSLFEAGACFACPIPDQGQAFCSVLDPIYDLNVLVWHPLLAFDGDLVGRGLLVGLLVRFKGGLAFPGPLADRARSWVVGVR